MVEKLVAANVLLVSETAPTATVKQNAVGLPERLTCPVEKLGESVRRNNVITQYYDKALGCAA
jgi:hypothetical protein